MKKDILDEAMKSMNKENLNKFKEAISIAKQTYSDIAEIGHIAYKELVDKGFNEEQALTIVITSIFTKLY